MNPLNILIVDDSSINLKLLRVHLEGEGHVVLSASNGLEALQVLDRERVELIISDLLMPEMDGYRLCAEVRRNTRFDQTAFIIYTATYTSPADEKLSLDVGADRFLRKPASIQNLRRAIAEAVAGTHRRPPVSLDGAVVLKAYNERLVSKLEEKNIELMAAASQISLQMAALETAADAILITDLQGTILWVNGAFTTTMGYSREEAIGKTPRILKSGRHSRTFYREFWNTITSGVVWRGEFTNRRKDGILGYDMHTVSPVRGTNGEITHFVGVMHDITERKRAEEELRDTHARLRQLLDHSPAVIYALAVKGQQVAPLLVSENITQLLGFSVPETMSYEWWQGRLHRDDRDRAQASIADTLTHGVSNTEYRLQHKDGSYKWVDDHRRLVRDALGTPSEIVGVWTDITERRRAEDELLVSEQRVSDMLRDLHLISIMLDRDSHITYCNDHLLRMTGWKREELLGRSWLEVFLPPEIRGDLKAVLASLLNDEPESRHHENEILTRSGEKRLIHWNNSVLRSTSGEVIGLASIGEDITDRKRLQNQLLRAQRLEGLGTLASGIAHDLNNLFMPILMGASLIKRFEPSERTQQAIANIEHCVKRGTDLVKQVLLFARGAEVSQVTVDVGSVVAEVEAIAASTFPKSVTFTTSVARNLPLLIGDPTQLMQVLLNLCVNARDALAGDGRITVSVSSAEISDRLAKEHAGAGAGRHVVLEVADNGAGMPQKIIDLIFEPFFTTKEVGRGTGLGLSTAQGIVRSHGGFMTVSSEVGRGSTFKVFLPLHPEGPTPIPSTRATKQEPPLGKGELILVVDDERAILDITRQALEASGYEVLTAEDGARAMILYADNRSRIALVLTDMMMPVMDGAALINGLRRIDPDVRIIAASGLDETSQVARTLDSGMSHFLAKPFSVDLMLRTVFQVLNQR